LVWVFCVYLVHFVIIWYIFSFWYVVQRKILQPSLKQKFYNLSMYVVSSSLLWENGAWRSWYRIPEPILRLLNLQLERQRFFRNMNIEGNIFILKTRFATRGVVNFFNAAVVTRDHRIELCFCIE
jgi:hypothetical protein